MATINVNEQGKFSARKVYDSEDAAFQNGDANTGVTVGSPHVIQLPAVPATSELTVEARVSADADWIPVLVATDTTEPQAIVFDVRMNFVRVVRTVGTDALYAHSQG